MLDPDHVLRVDHVVKVPSDGYERATEQLVLVNLRAAQCGLLIPAHAIIESCSQQRAPKRHVLNG